MARGWFITFEGGEGSGKSTQARLLSERLRTCGYETVLTREPGGPPLAEAIRNLIIGSKPANPDAECLLFAAARAEHLTTTIRPALVRGAIVVCDRFIDSTRVYQGAMGQVDRGLILALEQATVSPTFPDLTVLIDIPVSEGLGRVRARGESNRFDGADLGWHQALRAAFLAAAAAEPDRFAIVDGACDVGLVSDAIWQRVAAQFSLEPG